MGEHRLTVKEILEGVLAFYEDHEWIQGASFLAPDGRKTSLLPVPVFIEGACLEGACYLTAAGSALGKGFFVHDSALAEKLIADAARELFPDRLPLGGYANEFNDHHQTTREDALLAVKHAIGKCGEDEVPLRQE